jgi:uncharacterized integral membrane protein
MKYVYALLIFLLAITLAAFIQQNSQLTVLKYFGWQTPALPLSLFMVAAFAFGYLLAVVLGFTGGIRRKVRYTLLDRENRKLKDEIARRDSEASAESGQGTSEEESGTGYFAKKGSETVLLEKNSPEIEDPPDDGTGEKEI